jgi:hypothetical protein
VASFQALKQQLIGLNRVNGITPVEILGLPEDLHVAVRMMLKTAMTLEELAGELRLTGDEARLVGDLLVDKGFLSSEEAVEDGSIRYRVHLARMRPRNIPLDL